jgi:hypothetical protein
MEFYSAMLSRFGTDQNYTWLRVMKNLPVHDILYVYTVYDGKVQHRLNLVETWRNQTKRFMRPGGGWRTFENSNGMVLGGPLVMAPYEIPMKGFQGFRYVFKELF